MLFCPTCGNLLLIEKTIANYRFYCKSCPYICNINQRLKNYTKFDKKEVDSIFGGKEAWENVSKTEITCPKCSFDKAFFKQIQIRSADEPSTLFYKCANLECAYDWKEG